MSQLPETVLQFGTGKFLRAFADLFIHQANEENQKVGRVVAVQSTGNQRANLINGQGGHYHVLVRGLAGDGPVDRVDEVASISRALVADRQWDEVCAVARAPELRLIISNTAEVGYNLDPGDHPALVPPRSFPAKLLLILKARFEAGLPGTTVLPCELFDGNANLLRGLLLQLIQSWRLAPDLSHWIETECQWHNTLVDRIVCGKPFAHPLLEHDQLLAVTEPFAFWAIEQKTASDLLFRHPAIRRTADVRPFFLRKVRILNAAHTAMVCKALPRGIATVREAVLDADISAWLERLLFEEIVPTLEGRVEEPEAFARQTLVRFRNPFLEHKISDIAAYHDAKVQIRLVPTAAEFAEKFGRRPRLLDEAIAASRASA
jgi:tagaturonate reductase